MLVPNWGLTYTSLSPSQNPQLGQKVRKNQPFYHLLAENNEITYEAYVSEQNLITDNSGEPVQHPLVNEIFSEKKGSAYYKRSN